MQNSFLSFIFFFPFSFLWDCSGGILLQVLYKTALGMSNGLFFLSILSSRYDQRGNHRDPVLFQQDIRLI